MIEVRNLTKKYGEFVAVNDISFSVPTGQVLGFLGPNGAGKTTTVRILTCYMPPTSGTVTIDGNDVVEQSMEVRRKIGYLPESAPLYTEMDVIEYLEFVLALRGGGNGSRSKRIRHVVDMCGLGDVIAKNISELSKGYKQRVGLAQAMIHDPEILVLDEPTVGLDPNQIVEIRNLIKMLGREKTVVLCTHILPEVEATCDQVMIINKGKIVANGTPDSLQRSLAGKAVIRLEVNQSPETIRPMLMEIEGIEAVKAIQHDGTSKCEVVCRPGSDPREAIFHKAVSARWVLLEMSQEVSSLEDVFREMTKGGARE
ncbi:MAG: ATP-binding cassette domain-containing protein [bacterium]|nr:ATP-binding cassette domain-containing protein [bacterium]